MSMKRRMQRWRERHPERDAADRKANRDRMRLWRRVRKDPELMARRAQGICELCLEPSESLQLDHDHSTGEFRGWLCRNCNTALGKFKDSTELLRRAAAYLSVA